MIVVNGGRKKSTLCWWHRPVCMNFAAPDPNWAAELWRLISILAFCYFCFHVGSPSPHCSFVKLAFKSTRFSLPHPTIHRELPLRAEKLISIPATPYQFFFLPACLMMWSLSHIAMHPWVKCQSEAETQPWGAPAFIEVKLSGLMFSSQMLREVQTDKRKKSLCFSLH